MTRYAALVLLWTAWCFLHSFMITLTFTGFVRKHFEKAYQYYRIFYNFTALVTLIPVLAYAFSVQEPPVFRWEGSLRIIQGLLIASALVLFIGGARRYDLAQFIGIRQVRKNSGCNVLTDNCLLDTGGILGMVRHPWYAGGILIVWARNLDVAAILTNLVITGYFFIGAFLEERKLQAEFGDEYIDYQQNVSMLFPIKWVMKKIRS
jgi:protein-S-isoprenylcysteine O-methyltransferase Ste14